LIRSLALGLVTVMLLVACDPIPHPDVTVREAAGSGVRFRLLSGDGSFVVVQASGAGATVPGLGWWRVDRRDGSVVALPDANRAMRISRDGSRVLLELTAGGPVVLWADGTVLTPPGGARFSDDLTFAVFVDADGTVKTWETATQAVAPVEPGFPRPPGTTAATAKGISNDGRTVQYTLSSAAPTERFVDLDAGVAVDQPIQPELGDPIFVHEGFVLAANGDAFIHVHEIGEIVGPNLTLQESWAELVTLPDGQSARRFDNLTTTGQPINGDPLIAANGKVGWIYAERGELCQPPLTDICITASSAVAILANGSRTFNTGPNPLGSKDISTHGRFLVIDKSNLPVGGSVEGARGPVRVIDWVTGTVETLTKEPPSLTIGGQISDDQHLVATSTSDGGWYEYAAAPN
jgi:hypothetical protein